jgi:hypothetical protein
MHKSNGNASSPDKEEEKVAKSPLGNVDATIRVQQEKLTKNLTKETWQEHFW